MPPSSSSEDTSSASAESSDSGSAEKICTPPSTKPQKKSMAKSVSTPAKPASSLKRRREPQGKDLSKESLKKSKKPVQEDKKGSVAGVSEPDKSLKKNGAIWNPKDETAFLARLLAVCEKGKCFPKNLGAFYEAVRSDLDGDYNNDQLYNKVRGLRSRFNNVRDKIKNNGFGGFKNSHEEGLYRMSEQLWGNREDECYSEKADKGETSRGEKKKMKNIVVKNGKGKQGEMRRSEDVGMALKEEEEEENDDEEGEEQDEDEQNVTVNLSQQKALKEAKAKKRKEYGPSPVSGTAAQRSEDHNLNVNWSHQGSLKETRTKKRKEDGPSQLAGTGSQRGVDQNLIANLPQQKSLKGARTKKTGEDGPSNVAGKGEERSGIRKGENEGSSEEDAGEEQDSSDEDEDSGSESTDNEDSALPNLNGAVELLPKFNNVGSPKKRVSNGSKMGVSAGESSRKAAADGRHDVAENLAQLAPHNTSNGNHAMILDHQMYDYLFKLNCNKIFREVKKMLEELVNEFGNILDTLKKNLQAASNTGRATLFDYPWTRGSSFGRELPPLSKENAEMIDSKWQTQQGVEIEVACKHFTLMIEEYHLRLAEVNAKLSLGD